MLFRSGLELDPSGQALPLLQAARPGYGAAPSQAIDENQKEQNQYAHMVWRHDVTSNQFFSLAGYFRHTRATFKTDAFNVLAYSPDITGAQAADQDRMAYSGGLRLDYTYVHSKEHLIKSGFQFDRTQAVNKTRITAFDDALTGVVNVNADNRLIGYREEFWVQDQWTPNERWTFNLGVRGDKIGRAHV